MIVKYKGNRHVGSRNQYVASVILGVGGDGFRGSKHPNQRVDIGNSCDCQQKPQGKGGIDRCGTGSLCFFLFSGSQHPGHKITASHAKGEADGLNHGHQGKINAHRARSAGA